MSVKLSVITPVYNPPASLFEECAATALAQDFESFEWILVDDGSESSCAEALDELARRDSRVVVIHTSNNGAAAARSRGLEAARGLYVTFVDSDDRVTEGFFSQAMHIIETHDADIVCGRVRYCFEDRVLEKPFINKGHEVIFEGKDLESLRRYLLTKEPTDEATTGLGSFAPYTLYPKVFKRSVIGDITFDSRLIIGEDSLFVTLVAEQARLVVLVDESWYQYVEHEASTTNGYDKSKALSQLSCLDAYRSYMSNTTWLASDVGMRYFQSFFNIVRVIAYTHSFAKTWDIVRAIMHLPSSEMLSWIDAKQYKPSAKHRVMLYASQTRSAFLMTAIVKARNLAPR